MKRRARYQEVLQSILLSLLGVAMAGCNTLFGIGSDVISPSYLERPLWPRRVESPEGFLDYLTTYPDEFSLVAYWTDAPERGIYHNPEILRPLASTMKILVLIEYERQVEAGFLSPEERVSIDSLNVYYLPHTDGGAHARALKTLRREAKIEQETIALEEVARIMISHSSNAATDYLITRLGRAAIEQVPTRIGIPYAEAPLPLSGLFIGWNPNGIPVSTEQAYRWTARLRAERGFRLRHRFYQPLKGILFSYVEQRRNGRVMPKGAAKDYADVMAQIYAGTLLSPAISDRIRQTLSWPMTQKKMMALYEVYGTKGGSIPGVLTRAAFARPRFQTQNTTGGEIDNAGIVIALFIQDLPRGVSEQLLFHNTFNLFIRQVLTDPIFFEEVRLRLAAVVPR